MSARLATFCLVVTTVSAGWAQPAAPLNSRLVVYLRSVDSQPAQPVHYMKAELEAIMSRAGYEVDWKTASEPVDAPFVVVVEFSGKCASGPGEPLREATSLASTLITDGRVLPFSRIDCTALTRSVGRVGDFLYGQAMARLLAHELYHVLAQTTDHGRSGIAKPCFSTSDLLSARFDFEEKIRVQLRALRVAPAAAEPAEEEALPAISRSQDFR